ncbi:putative late blight resistance protein homolog R1B-14 isoform X1 [Camellia sinensis]|uniref:putative late blight resistance protein homolog R1B-14 isoform X1 n=1 Tax=Camellia sinensis TaxID=4442 RepID=UPI0010364F58|nr:putative late blight resistance protein homolog R1B-14 isoform X1 [Camellia sinensis]XP_028102119.1 putative late blight resistance protein homolog R1B-14 isoform X2 [Camellia sinensis]XP_028102121.1 putative late blight resistance protein homolog R1B-14 isoform X1 [Camellia sinensis]
MFKFQGRGTAATTVTVFFEEITIMEEIKTIEAKVVQFYGQINQIQLLQDDQSFNHGVHSSMSMSMENRTMVHEEITVGFDDEALTIKQLLAGGKKQLQMISIVGMPGLGKTTLATKLYNDPYISHYFHIRAWTYASQLPRITDMLLDILRSVNVVFTDEIKNMTNEKLGEKLYKQLKGKRYLIVIDDLWDIGAWVNLKMYFPNDNNGSRVMFTSRLKEVAMHASPDCHRHCLRFLTEEESWELLQRKMFQNESCPPELIGIGKQIRFDGRIKACRMHDLLRDLCLKKAREINFLQQVENDKDASPSSSSNCVTNNQRRLCTHSNFFQKSDYVSSMSYAPTVVQSFLCFRSKLDHYHDNRFGDVCSFICQTFKLLKVLDIWYNSAFFSRELTQLVNLRYLAINLTIAYELPPPISNLSNLETLIIISTNYVKVILPCNVWKIPKLRHLYAKGGAKVDVSLCSEEAAVDQSYPRVLKDLRTITDLDPCGSVQDFLARTPYLTKLGICVHLLSASGNLMFPNLEFLGHLDTLKLYREFLHSTYLREVKFPRNVKRLTLKCTRIKWEEISVLGMLLPNLELLKLENDAGWEWHWTTIDGGFPRLKFLKLKNLKFERWITCYSHFPSLQHLSLEMIEKSRGNTI